MYRNHHDGFDQKSLSANNKEMSDILKKRYGKTRMLATAQHMLTQEDLSEESFLGAQGVLLLHGLI